MSKKGRAWAWFAVSLLLLSLGGTSYGKTADVLFDSLGMVFFAILSCLTLRQWWRSRLDPQDAAHHGQGDAELRLLQRWRRWVRDE